MGKWSKTIAIKDHEGLCWNCLKTKKDIHKIVIPELGYGGGFDGSGTEVHLCEECYQKSNPEIWGLKVIEDKDEEGNWWGEEYEHEKEMFDFFYQMPMVGRQFVLNEFQNGWNADRILDPQDWIDYEEKTLPHENCKELGLYSHQEIDAYRERFPICEHPVNKVYKDGSCGSCCPYGAFGRKDQETDLNISNECYLCKHFKERTTPRKEIKAEDWSDYCVYIVYGDEMDKLKEKFGD